MLASRWLIVLGALALVVGFGTTVGRSVPGGIGGDTWAMITAFTDFGLVAYAVAAVCFGVALGLRFRVVTLVALAASVILGGVHASWIVPRYVGDAETPMASGRLTVLAENLMLGAADPEAVVADAQGADVLVVVEATQAAAEGLDRYGIARRFPYKAGGPLPARGAAGTRLYSRFPITETRPLDRSASSPNPTDGNYNWVARIAVPELGPITIVATHPTRPVPGSTRWWPEQEKLLTELPGERTIAAGDFNAVDSHPSLRQLGESGFRSAAEIVGSGWQPTFPAQGRVPPLITIDHILLSPDLTATEFRTVDIAGSDHRGVLAAVALRS